MANFIEGLIKTVKNFCLIVASLRSEAKFYQVTFVAGLCRFALRDFLILFFLINIILISPATRSETLENSYSLYQVKKSETLSDVLFRLRLIPLYGKKGSINQVAKINHQKVLKDGNLIFAQTLIILPISQTALEQALATETSPLPLPSRDVAASPETENLSPAPIVETIHAEAPPVASLAAAPTPAPAPPPVLAAPTAAATPVQGEAKILAPAYVPTSEVSITAQGDYVSLHGEDLINHTTGKLLSKLNTGFILDWKQNWDEGFSSLLFVGTKSLRFESEAHGTALHNSSLSTFTLGAGFQSKLSPKWQWGLSGEYGDQLFYRGYQGSGGGLEINAVQILRIHPRVQYLLLERKPLSLQVEGGVSSFSSGNYDNYSINSGWGYDLGLYMNQAFTQKDFRCGVIYSERNQSTSLITLSDKSVGLNCKFGWGL